MKAAALTAIERLEIIEQPTPEIQQADDVLLRVRMVGICGSDMHYYQTGTIGTEGVEYPFVCGHECAATVVAVGSDVTEVKVSDKVVVEPAVSCGKCDQCLAGRENTCRNLKFLGCPGQLPGCLSEYIVMPERCCYKVEQEFSFEGAVLCETLSIALYAAENAGIDNSKSCAVLGCGPIGLSCILTSKALGADNIYATEIIPERVNVAETTGITWIGNPQKEDVIKSVIDCQPNGVDIVFECAGKQETIDQAVEILKPGGKLMLIGIPRIDRISFVIERIRRKEISIINVRRQNNCTARCIELVASGKIQPDFMVTHYFSLEQTQQAFDLVSNYADGVVKAVIKF
ncbi:MAG: alcohol dehydrogenase catalytic domain-containing protein [Sedimentisphaerales bacterium]|nr:alcohol dehydrogenase catalytic domain-containing protein [Sedimentisphaerales bacterium]